MPFSIGFVMDVAILLLLAGTVFFVFQLNTNLRRFRQSRAEMEGLVTRLTANIDRAEKAIAGLQVSARNSGADLDKKIKEAKFLGDELKFMNEAGDSLAARLEKLADRNRELVEKIEAGGGLGPATPAIESTIVVREAPARKAAPEPVTRAAMRDTGIPDGAQDNATDNGGVFGFAIQDREFDADFLDEEEDDGFGDLDMELEAASAARFQSQAEREFFEALQKRKPAGGRN